MFESRKLSGYVNYIVMTFYYFVKQFFNFFTKNTKIIKIHS